MRTFKERDDVAPAGYAPLAYRKELRKAGGLNPYGESLYRLVLAQYVFEWHGGEFWDWPEEATLHEQGGMEFSDEIVRHKHLVKTADPNVPVQMIEYEGPAGMVVSTTQPIRKVVEIRWVQRYPELEGWILQRWRPASHWGPREAWERMVYPGTSIQMLGPYPDRGKYEFATEFVDVENGKPVVIRQSRTEIYGLSHVIDCVQFLEQNKIDQYGNDPAVRLRVAQSEYEARRAAQAMENSRRESRRAQVREAMRPFLSNSLAGGRLREEIARRAGVREHVGN